MGATVLSRGSSALFRTQHGRLKSIEQLPNGMRAPEVKKGRGVTSAPFRFAA